MNTVHAVQTVLQGTNSLNPSKAKFLLKAYVVKGVLGFFFSDVFPEFATKNFLNYMGWQTFIILTNNRKLSLRILTVNGNRLIFQQSGLIFYEIDDLFRIPP